MAASDRCAGPDDAHGVFDDGRHGVHLPALHDPARIREPGQNGRSPAGGCRRPGLDAVSHVPAGDRSAVDARDHRRLDAGADPQHRRVRDPGAAGRHLDLHDRPGAVGRVLQEYRLVDGLGRSGVDGGADPDSAGRVQPLSDPRRGPGQRRMNSGFGRAWLAFGYAFLYIPIATLIAFSFNASKMVTLWGGFSLHWYHEILHDSELIDGFVTSLKIALMTATASIVLGTLAAFTLVRYRDFFGRTLFIAHINAPLVVPEVITGLSLLLFFVACERVFGIFAERGIVTIWIGHTSICACYAAVVIQSRLLTMDKSLEEAAMNLGCSSFLNGPGVKTLPIVIFARARLGLNPTVNAVATLSVVVVSIGVLAGSLWMARSERRRAEEQAAAYREAMGEIGRRTPASIEAM